MRSLQMINHKRGETASVPQDNLLVRVETLGPEALAIFSSKQNKWIVLEEVAQEFAIIDWKPL